MSATVLMPVLIMLVFRLSTPWSTSIPLCTTLTTGASGEVPPPTTPPVTPPIISVTLPTGLLPVAPPVTPPIAPVTPPITLVNPPTGLPPVTPPVKPPTTLVMVPNGFVEPAVPVTVPTTSETNPVVACETVLVTVESTLESKPDVETFPLAIFMSETFTLTGEPVFTTGFTDTTLPRS